jgi:phosphate transport system ATP-binding protein
MSEAVGISNGGDGEDEVHPVRLYDMPSSRSVVSREDPNSSAGTAEATQMVPKLETKHLSFYYGQFRALKDISLAVPPRQITALIGPSGCGKSTLIRVFNRMYELVPGARVEGTVTLDGENVLGAEVDVITLRHRIGMVFQRPNPFPMSIYDNVAAGPRILRMKVGLDEVVEKCLRQAALWDEVKDRLRRPALSLSGGQQQRLALARTLAVEPEVILMDEPASALDPIATLKLEDLAQELKRDYTIVIVTHNMQQAARVSDNTAFLMMTPERHGELVEFGPTVDIFNRPKNKLTEDYITGRFG